MYCSNCGTQNENSARFCTACGFVIKDLKKIRLIPETKPQIKPVSINDITFISYLSKRIIFLLFWFLFHGFALFVNVFGLQGELKHGYKCGESISTFSLFTSSRFPETSEFWPFVKIFEDDVWGTNECYKAQLTWNKDYGTQKLTKINGFFQSYDYSEFLFYTILILIILFFSYEAKKPFADSKEKKYYQEPKPGKIQTAVANQNKKGNVDTLTIVIIIFAALVLIAVIAEVVNKNTASSNNPVTHQTEATASAVDATGASESQVDSVSQIPKTDADLVFVQGGSFLMGGDLDENNTNIAEHVGDQKPIHRVYVNSFYIGKYEVTFNEYDAYCEATGTAKPGDEGWGRGNHPVINVNWEDAIKYCDWKTSTTGKNYRLPSEAEWEYAARGGARSNDYSYSGSNDIGSVAWYYGNSDISSGPHLVGKKKSNELDLYDMTGNVYEWCSDWYDENYYSQSPTQNPQGATYGKFHVIRGGSWRYIAIYALVSFRRKFGPIDRADHFGFRVVVD